MEFMVLVGLVGCSLFLVEFGYKLGVKHTEDRWREIVSKAEDQRER